MNHLPDFNLSSLSHLESEFAKTLKDNFHHFVNLQKIMKHHGGVKNSEGSYMMNGQTLDYHFGMYDKQEKLYNMSKNKEHIIEIGVNAAHSLFLMCLANSKADFYLFDICSNAYVNDCVLYLQHNFPNLMHLYIGDSKSVYPLIVNKLASNNIKFDLFHIDGLHTEEYVDLEIKASRKISGDDAVFVIDDIIDTGVQNAVNKNNMFQIYRATGDWPNAFYVFL